MAAHKKVLFVVDDLDIQSYLDSKLSNKDWDIERCPHTSDIVSRARETNYNLIVTGAASSVSEDLEVLRQIKELRPNTRVIVMTYRTTPDDVIEALRANAFSLFSQPFSASALTAMIEQALEVRGGEDDIEVLSAKPEWIALRVHCSLAAANRLFQFVNEMEVDLPPEHRDDISMAFRELLLNAIEHGGKNDPSQTVDICCLRTDRFIIYNVRDPGPGFSFENLPHSALSNPAGDPCYHEDLRVEQGMRYGGFGIMLAKSLGDELIYNEKGNEVVFVKYLDSLKPANSLAGSESEHGRGA